MVSRSMAVWWALMLGLGGCAVDRLPEVSTDAEVRDPEPEPDVEGPSDIGGADDAGLDDAADLADADVGPPDAEPDEPGLDAPEDAPPDEPDAPTVLSFVDDDRDDFGLGRRDRVKLKDDFIHLESNQAAGSFTSRVFDAGADARWTALRWTPALPYGAPLPDGRGQEGDFPQGGADMSANVLLLHLEGTGSQGRADGSGRGHDASVLGGGMEARDGVVGQGVALDGPTSLQLSAEGHPDFDFGQGGFTWALWFRTTQGCDRNTVAMGGEDRLNPRGGSRTHLWIGGACSFCDGGNVGSFTLRDSTNGGVSVCHTRAIDDGRWHHMAFVKDGHRPAALKLWIDGVRVELSHNFSPDGTFDMVDDRALVIGNFPGQGYPTAGSFDEVAIWKRALTNEEVEALFERGAGRVRLQIQRCDGPDCQAPGPFIGPDGTPDTSFDAAEADTTPFEVALPESMGQARYVRYRLTFEAFSRARPTVTRVELEATIP